MTALNCDCPPLDGVSVCSPLPLAFVRLRYFFGKRLGVADFVDEQLYHAAKTRFHNQRLHGAGVVCGLRASVLSTAGLRVGKGAALDRCGREIIVGADQCIDVDAWIARELEARRATDPNTTWPASDLDANGRLALRIVLRYRECTTSPEPAPRDPCACDNGGCDFGRIREAFELDLCTEAQAAEFVAPTSFPSSAALSSAIASAVSGATLSAQLATLISAPAPDPTGEDWLIVGALNATLDVNQKVSALALEPSPASYLLETSTLGDLLLRALAAYFEPGALLDDAPQVLSAGFASDAGTNKIGTNNLVTLTLSSAIVAKTLTSASVNMMDPGAGWSAVGGGGAPAFSVGPPNEITIPIGTLTAGKLYRLALASDRATPICDDKLRPLLPLHFAWDFAVDSGGNVSAASFA